MALFQGFKDSECSYYLAIFGGTVAVCWGIKFALSLFSGLKGYVLSNAFGIGSNIKSYGSWAGMCTLTVFL
jgi:hypothetical protein